LAEQVCVQHPPSAVNTALPHLLLSAMLRRRCCSSTAPRATDHHLLLARNSAANLTTAVAAEINRTDGQTDHFTHSAPHYAGSVNISEGQWLLKGS